MEPAQKNTFSKLKLFLSINKFWAILFAFFFTSSVGMTTYLLAVDSHPPSSKLASENIPPIPTPISSPQTVITDAPSTSTLTPTPTIIIPVNPTATKAGTLSITLSYGTRPYLEALALDPQAGTVITAASVSATKKDSKDSNGYKATNVIVPFGSNTLIFNAKDAYLNLFNQMLTTLKLTK